MGQAYIQTENELGFPVADSRFDQKNEMFKRAIWDEKMQSLGNRFYRDIKYQDKDGYRKIDYAFRNAAWNLEWSAGFGNSCGNSGLFSWEGVPEKIRGYVETDGPVEESPEKMSGYIKNVARFVGADLVGICRVHPNCVYSHEYNLFTHEHYPIDIPQECSYAVLTAVAMDYKAMHTTPSGVGGASTGLGYSKMVFVASLLANFIRGIGYRAIPCGNDTALSVPLAMAAGLSEFSRMGLMITEKYGPRVRLCKVFTDLPLAIDRYRPFGVTEFCKTCEKCADNCPSRAIPHGPMTTEGPPASNQHGVLKWYVNPELCYSFWSANRVDCASCIRSCPYNKPRNILHDVVPFVSRRTTAFNKFFVWLDDLMGYGKLTSSRAFWDRS